MNFVYFLRPIGAEGPVKIGYSNNPESRLKEYLHWSPMPLYVAATIPGGRELEARFHQYFADSWTHHEWFRASAALSLVIDAINAGTFNTDVLPEKERCTRFARSERSRSVGGLKISFAHVVRRSGAKPPADVLEAVARVHDLWGDEFDEAQSLIYRWIYQPYERGSVAPEDMETAEKYRAYCRYRKFIIGPDARPAVCEVAQ